MKYDPGDLRPGEGTNQTPDSGGRSVIERLILVSVSIAAAIGVYFLNIIQADELATVAATISVLAAWWAIKLPN